MDKFTIIANSVKDRNFVVSHRIAEYLRNNGKECLMLQDMGEEQNASYHYTDPDRIPDDTQCIIVLGGDGTLLQAARDVQCSGSRCAKRHGV